MVNFKKARPGSITNLRKWAPGRVSQLRLMLSHLEQGVNDSLAAQVLQSPKRTFSEFIPKIPIQNITAEVSFREIRVKFIPPKGLRKLLFYEFSISTSENFAQFERFFSPEAHFVFTDLQDDVTFYINIRIVSADGRVGPYSEAVEVSTPRARAQLFIEDREFVTSLQPFSQAQIYQAANTDEVYDTLAPLPSSSANATRADTVELFRFNFESLGSSLVYYSIDYELSLILGSNVASPIHWLDIIFRWFEDANEDSSFEGSRLATKQAGQDIRETLYGMKVNADFVATSDSGTISAPGPFGVRRMGTLIQKPRTFTAGDHVVTLGVVAGASSIYPTTNDWTLGSGRTFGDTDLTGPKIKVSVRNFNLFEVIIGALS